MKYLIHCGSGIGDIIIILPLAQIIKRHDPNSYIKVFVCADKQRVEISKELLSLQNLIDEIDYYSVKAPIHDIKFIYKLGYKHFDIAFSLQYTNNKDTSAWPSRILKICAKKSIGIKIDKRKGVHYDEEISLSKGIRMADYPLIMYKQICYSPFLDLNIDYDSLIDTSLLNKELPYAKRESLSYIALVVGTAPVGGRIGRKYYFNDVKKWDKQNWLALAKRLSLDGYGVLLIGGGKEKKEFSDHCNLHDDNIINLIGNCGIVQSLSALYSSILVVGADTGLMHCAGALDIPTLTLYGCTDYKEYLPFGRKAYYLKSDCTCSPCFGTEISLTCKKNRCMKEISVDDVYKKIKDVIEGNISVVERH